MFIVLKRPRPRNTVNVNHRLQNSLLALQIFRGHSWKSPPAALLNSRKQLGIHFEHNKRQFAVGQTASFVSVLTTVKFHRPLEPRRGYAHARLNGAIKKRRRDAIRARLTSRSCVCRNRAPSLCSDCAVPRSSARKCAKVQHSLRFFSSPSIMRAKDRAIAMVSSN